MRFDGEGLQKIGESAFSDCTALKSVKVPTTLTKIGNNAFARCTALFEVSFRKVLRFVSENPVEGLLPEPPLKVRRMS